MSTQLTKILEFTAFLNKFREIERAILIKNSSRNENDTEHSYQLAMLSWYINTLGGLNYNLEKIIKYSLVHDLVEIYAGDTVVFSPNLKEHESKHDRELQALDSIEKEFLEFPELAEMIKEYNKKQDAESKFVYVLDKIIPVLNLYLEGGTPWKTQKITLKMLLDNKLKKVKQDKYLNAIFEELADILTAKEKDLFFIG